LRNCLLVVLNKDSQLGDVAIAICVEYQYSLVNDVNHLAILVLGPEVDMIHRQFVHSRLLLESSIFGYQFERNNLAMNDSERAEYLSRIKLSGCHSNLAGLKSLQEHHTENIPFENLDIVVGRNIVLQQKPLFDKIISKKRGGYCFELNILYCNLLTSIGFSAKPVLARVWLSNPKNIPPRNHLAILVELDGKTFVTDVGFAGLVTRVPLDINNPAPVNDKDGMVRVIPFDDDQFMIQRQNEKGWANLYSFENTAIGDEDIEIAHFYMSKNPKSHLIQHKCVGRNTDEGRVGLFNNKVTTRKANKLPFSQRVEFGESWLEKIKEEFYIELDFSKEELNSLFENKT
jgi:N-hydroxyarylamine O-acetyltransferase